MNNIMYMYDGVVFTPKEVEREFISLCRECAHYGEPEPDWIEYISDFEVIGDDYNCGKAIDWR